MFRLLLISCAAYTTIRLFSLFGTRNADGRTLCIGYYTVFGWPPPPAPPPNRWYKTFLLGKILAREVCIPYCRSGPHFILVNGG